LFCYFLGVAYPFLAENLYFESQTNKKLKNYPKIQNCVRRAAKITSTRTASQSLIAMGFSLLPANFPSNRNVALHACSLWTTLIWAMSIEQ